MWLFHLACNLSTLKYFTSFLIFSLKDLTVQPQIVIDIYFLAILQPSFYWDTYAKSFYRWLKLFPFQKFSSIAFYSPPPSPIFYSLFFLALFLLLRWEKTACLWKVSANSGLYIIHEEPEHVSISGSNYCFCRFEQAFLTQVVLSANKDLSFSRQLGAIWPNFSVLGTISTIVLQWNIFMA